MTPPRKTWPSNLMSSIPPPTKLSSKFSQRLRFPSVTLLISRLLVPLKKVPFLLEKTTLSSSSFPKISTTVTQRWWLQTSQKLQFSNTIRNTLGLKSPKLRREISQLLTDAELQNIRLQVCVIILLHFCNIF